MPRFQKGSPEAKEWGRKMREAQQKKKQQQPSQETPKPTEPTKEVSRADLGLQENTPQPSQEKEQTFGSCSECGLEIKGKTQPTECPNCHEKF